jgi:hypothetical protein
MAIISALLKHRPANEAYRIREAYMTDGRKSFTKAVRQGATMVVSDGSFCDQTGTAAVILVYSDSTKQIREEMSAYSSKLAGHLAIQIFVQCLCSFHNIENGRITVGCDGLSALHQANRIKKAYLPADIPSYDFYLLVKAGVTTGVDIQADGRPPR